MDLLFLIITSIFTRDKSLDRLGGCGSMNKIHLGITVFLRHNTECRNHGVNVMLIEHFGNR